LKKLTFFFCGSEIISTFAPFLINNPKRKEDNEATAEH